jgi:hypothetical protein
LSIEQRRRTEAVYAVIQELFTSGKQAVRPGDVNTVLRERSSPMGTWEVRAEFSRLEHLNCIECNADTGLWHLTENASLKDAG